MLLCAAAILTGTAAFSMPSEPEFSLTLEDRAILENLRNRPVVIAYSCDLARSELYDIPFGMLDPVLEALTNEFGLTVELVKTNWQDAFSQLESGQVDFYGPVALSEARRTYITTGPFYRGYANIITRADRPVGSMPGLYNRSVGLPEGSVIARAIQAYLGPNGQILHFPTMDAMIEGLRDGRVDAFVTADNAELELLSYDDIRFEFTIDNFYVDQGFISGNEDMRGLAALLSRYWAEHPRLTDQMDDIRRQALLRFSQQRFAPEIAHVRERYEEIVLYADPTLYPLCYLENGVIHGMQTEIHQVFEDLTGVPVRYVTDRDGTGGLSAAVQGLKSGAYMAVAGGCYNLDLWEDPDVQYSRPLWQETMRVYAYQDIRLFGKRLGVLRMSQDYLGWSGMTGNAPLLYDSTHDLLDALKRGEVDAVFMGETRFDYGHTVLSDYRLREIPGLSAEAARHMLYGAQNREVNTLLDGALELYPILNPQAIGQWTSYSGQYKNNYIRARHTRQIWMAAAIVIFMFMLAALIHLLRRDRRSLSETKRRNRALLEEVHHDALTGAYNRRFMEDSLKRVLRTLSRSGGTLSLLMIDVDFFKKYNDAYGHTLGDRCLKAVAEALEQSVTRADDFVARYGGEEFAVILPNTGESGARLIANKLLGSVRDRNILHESSDAAPCVTVSIGVTTGRVEHTQNADDYVRRADQALYQSKQRGRNRYTFARFEG